MTGDSRLHFAVLGAFQMNRDGLEVDPGPRLQRMLLAILVVEARHIVPVDRLIDLLWRNEPPAQLRDVGLHRGDGRGRRLLPPQQVEQPVHRHDTPGLHHQDRQQHALQPRAEVEFTPVLVHPEGAQDSKVQTAVASHPGHRPPSIIQVWHARRLSALVSHCPSDPARAPGAL